jgi:putative hemolysin
MPGDLDEHGCYTPANYSWCEAKQKCLRTWEENCTAETANSETGIQAKAKEFCNKENVGSVNICETYIEVNSKLLGGGAKYYDLNGTLEFSCPVVAPDSMSKKCKEIFEGRLAETFKCEKICPAEGCGECPQLVAPAPNWCNDGTVVAGVKNECGCQGPPKCIKACTEEAKICPDGSAVGRVGPNCEFAPCPSVGIANPASVFCKAQGGESKIITAQDGSQSGVCTLKDGTQCDEWAYYRGECPE